MKQNGRSRKTSSVRARYPRSLRIVIDKDASPVDIDEAFVEFLLAFVERRRILELGGNSRSAIRPLRLARKPRGKHREAKTIEGRHCTGPHCTSGLRDLFCTRRRARSSRAIRREQHPRYHVRPTLRDDPDSSRSAKGINGELWDSEVPSVDVCRKLLRVCKPGAPLLGFGDPALYDIFAIT